MLDNPGLKSGLMGGSLDSLKMAGVVSRLSVSLVAVNG